MNKEQYNKIKDGKGFIAALDQSGGSTPKALERYGIKSNEYNSDDEMFKLVHEMRTRIVTSKSFDNRILGVILFKETVNSMINDKFTADYLWEDLGVVPFLKVDSGLEKENNGICLMKEIEDFDGILKLANKRNIFGTKMRSVIYTDNEESIRKVVSQQFEFAKKILEYDLMPIIEPEVDIHIDCKEEAEKILNDVILEELDKLDDNKKVMLKLTIPTIPNTYKDLINHDKVLRVVALSGGYDIKKANEELSKNHGLIASFSRALVENLSVSQSDDEFDKALDNNISEIFKASIN